MGDIETVIAWATMVGIFLLSVIYPLRKYCASKKLPKTNMLFKANRFLRKFHKPLGILMIPITFLHCRFSSQKLGMNLGTLCLILLVSLLLTYILRKLLKGRWIKLHRVLTAILWILIATHIMLDTERIKGFLMQYFSLTNIFWYYAAYGVVTFTVMQFMPKEKRKKILTYTFQGTFIEKMCALLSLVSRYAMMLFSLFLPFSSNIYFIGTGNFLYFVGLMLSTLAMWQFSKVQANRPITSGLYHISRNPMQVMGFLMCIGIAMIANNLWLWLLTVLNIITSYPMFLMQEKYCIEKYGKEYMAYMSKVPRILIVRPKNGVS